MKIKHFRRMNSLHNTVRAGCVAGIGMMIVHVQAGVSEPAPVLEEETAELPPNWVDVTVGGAFVDGDKAAYQRRVQQDGDFYGGISDMHMESIIGDLTWTLDGHAMFGNEDYELILGLVKDDLGYLEAGYRQFRTWYDGSGGYLPTVTPSWYPAADEGLHLDRGELWLEAGLRREDLPEITFRYTHSWREGDKDSTSWSRPDSRAIAPTMWDIDEQSDVFELDVAYALGNTDLGLGLRYEMIDNSDSKIFFDDESHTEGYEADIFNAHASSVTRFNDQMMLSFGYAYTNLNSDTFVSRGADIQGFNDGGANQKLNVANCNFWWNPIEDLVIVPSIRAEWNDVDAVSKFYYHPHYGSPGWANPRIDVDGNMLTEQIDARYTGIENVSLYAKATFEQEEEDSNYRYYQDTSVDLDETPTYAQSGYRNKECDANRFKGSIGGIWYACRGLSFAAEYYYKDTDLDYDTDNFGTGLTHFGDAHIKSLEMSTNDINVRMTWRARPDLTFVTRYDWQVTEFDMTAYDGTPAAAILPGIQSGEYERNIISESVTYLLNESAYLQGAVSYTWSDTVSAGSQGASSIVSTSDNDYLTASLMVGYALDEKTDITAGYAYYYADNFSVPVNSVGYGTDLEEHVFSVGLNRQINRNMIWNLGYGYYTSNDGTSGGNNDFDAHMVSTGLQVRF